MPCLKIIHPKKEENQSQSSPETEQKIANTFVNKTIETLIQWMPVGGSGWVFFSFLKDEV